MSTTILWMLLGIGLLVLAGAFRRRALRRAERRSEALRERAGSAPAESRPDASSAPDPASASDRPQR